MIKQIFLALLIFVLLAAGFVIYQSVKTQIAGSRTRQIKIGETVFSVEIADNFSSRARGLSGRDGLGSHEGMLFVFPVAMPQGFWMKEMKFPIDIIWIKDNKVAGIVIGAEPEAGPDYTIYRSPENVDKVLEIGAGLSVQFGIKIGDEVTMVEMVK